MSVVPKVRMNTLESISEAVEVTSMNDVGGVCKAEPKV